MDHDQPSLNHLRTLQIPCPPNSPAQFASTLGHHLQQPQNQVQHSEHFQTTQITQTDPFSTVESHSAPFSPQPPQFVYPTLDHLTTIQHPQPQPGYPIALQNQLSFLPTPAPTPPVPVVAPRRKAKVTMGPRADCEKCRLGVKGHWMHFE